MTKRSKYSFDFVKCFIENIGGKLHSTEYKGVHAPLIVECQCGHIWHTNFNRLKRGGWCSLCHFDAKKLSFEMVKREIELMGGVVLSNKYKNAHSKLEIKCGNDHIFNMSYNNIKYGCWCVFCSNRPPVFIEDIKQIATNNGGECISDKYVDNRTKLIFRCGNNHIWKAAPYSIKSGKWCPYCNSSISEEICRSVLEKIFNSKFPKKRPKWLIGPSGNRMELDGHCSDLNIAFEHNGMQHYKVIDYFNDEKSFLLGKKHDKLKAELCAQNNIKLIIIPALFDITEIKDLACVLNKEFIRLKINCFVDGISDIDFASVYNKNILKCTEIINKKAGRLLSSVCVNNSSRLDVECENHHNFTISFEKLKQNRWCPFCSKTCKKTMDDVVNLATLMNGVCISQQYKNSKEKLLWKCNACNNRWLASWDVTKRGKWCKCIGKYA